MPEKTGDELLLQAIETIHGALGDRPSVHVMFDDLLHEADILHACGNCGYDLDPVEQANPCPRCDATNHIPEADDA